eukprot:TRINITY_DN19746_c0_g1_i1.p1 TRINITY_DN19746_c0_g1~~TRINITY_DN19746_c0_g1_i1.p1  ORF type:complete len:522 (-),score=132.39 TRINITY_DN19746_c0_g1_i1:161-1726(-)
MRCCLRFMRRSHPSSPFSSNSNNNKLLTKRPRTTATTSSGMSSLTTPTISLTEREETLFSIVRTAAQPTGITVRVAGGWVRDKVCGKDSHDIDFAVDRNPLELISAVQKHCAEKDDGKGSNLISGIGTVQVNAEKGKNMQTETFILMGFPIDVVPLRTSQASLDKEKKIGTPEEDVLYRDFTVNALFFNIMTLEVEDFLPEQMGLKDLLQNHVVRTPISASRTLFDDPIRAVRAVRFATKLGFEVDQDIAVAARSQEVQQRLLKASRERFGLEVMKMVEGPDFLKAMQLICNWTLFEIMFLPEMVTGVCVESGQSSEDSKEAQDCLSSLSRILEWKKRGIEIVPFLYDLDEELNRALPLASFLLPLNRVPAVKTKKPRTIQWHIMADGLKLPHKDADNVEKLVESARRFSNSLRVILSESNHLEGKTGDIHEAGQVLVSERLELGRNIRLIGLMWRHALLLGLINLNLGPDYDWLFHAAEKYILSVQHDKLVDWKYLIPVKDSLFWFSSLTVTSTSCRVKT